jgi:hypothetical protein
MGAKRSKMVAAFSDRHSLTRRGGFVETLGQEAGEARESRAIESLPCSRRRGKGSPGGLLPQILEEELLPGFQTIDESRHVGAELWRGKP